MSYEFNGLIDSVLPNIYINRITLEHLHSQPLGGAGKYDITPHINQALPPQKMVNMGTGAEDDYEMVAEESLTPTYNAKDGLRVTFDMFLEIPNIDSNDFWSAILSDDILKYLTVELFLFSGKKGKHRYRSKVVGKQISHNTLVSYASQLPEVHRVTNGSILDQILEPGKFMGEHSNQGKTASQTLKHIKQKYIETLPDGTIVHKVPIHMSAELNNGAFPSDLAAAAFCALDIDAVINDTGVTFPTLHSSNLTIPSEEVSSADTIGRVASEVIIKDGKAQGKGMIFYISNDQIDDDEDTSIQRDLKFEDKKGELWFGNVRWHNNRYMARPSVYGQADTVHPYLDYRIVPNTRIQDYRQIGAMQKQMVNFTSLPNRIFGGDYIDRRSSTSAVATNNPAIFSDLISSVNTWGRVKLFFTFDLGRLIKKHCAVPALIDRLALEDEEQLITLLNQKTSPISFKIFRERISGAGDETGKDNKELIIPPEGSRIAKNIVDQDNEKLIYDGYPNLHYFDNEKRHVSSLVPVGQTSFVALGHFKNYSLTDRSLSRAPKSTNAYIQAANPGVYRYSIKIEMYDPTFNWFVSNYKVAIAAVKMLKKYSVLANGTTDVGTATETPYYNKYLRKFNNKFIEKAKTGIGLGFGAQPGTSNAVPDVIIAALNSFKFISTITRDRNTPVVSEIGTVDHGGPTSDDWITPIQNMLDPQVATPDTIASAYEIFNTFTSQIKNFIESFSTAKIPKESSGTDTNGNPILQQFTKMTIGASIPKRKITVEHVFGGRTELVDTRYMKAGHEIFSGIPGLSQYDIGLKIIGSKAYSKRAETEQKMYFSKTDTVTLQFKMSGQYAGNELPVLINPEKVNGRFFTVLKSSPFFNTTYTILPETIKSWDEENEYWKLANNIIRYKFGLLGNPGPKSFLGYGKEYEDLAKNPDDTQINDAMERIIKEYQSLSYKGVVFTPEKAAAEDPTGQDDPLGKFTEIDKSPTTPSFLLPAGNIGQERFLLALIMQDYLNLRFNDLKLGSFDISKMHSAMATYLNKSAKPVIDTAQGMYGAVQSLVNDLPNQIKVLMLQYGGGQDAVQGETLATAGFINNLNPKVVYSAWKSIQPDNFYAEGLNDSNMETMYTSKFGEFWFRHQNLMELEYLGTWGSVLPVPPAVPASQITEILDTGPVYTPPAIVAASPPTTYEERYSSSVKLPRWHPVDANMIKQLESQTEYSLLLCRFKKYRHPIFNQKAYDLLDLPLYDEYFFLWTGPESGEPDPLYKEPLEAHNTTPPSPSNLVQTSDKTGFLTKVFKA